MNLVKRHSVESKMLLGPSDVSPESAGIRRHPDSWAYKIFPSEEIEDHREFDRAALGLFYLHAALNENRKAFLISNENYNRIVSWVKKSIKFDEDVFAWSWALLYNDLGKLKEVNQAYEKLYGYIGADHDQVLAALFKSEQYFTLFPTMKLMGEKYRKSLIEGLDTGFNLGKAAMLECPDVIWDSIKNLDEFSANFHFGHSFFDFLGVNGAINPTEALPYIMNDNNVEAFLGVIENPKPEAYKKKRSELVCLPDKLEFRRFNSVIRIIGMTRIFDIKGGQEIINVIESLPDQVKLILDRELTVSGRVASSFEIASNEETSGWSAVEPHYAPALLANVKRIASLSSFTVKPGHSKNPRAGI